jgi:predicted N-acetyltransferase YhbS
MNEWLKETAKKSEGETARTYVVCRGHRTVGYYTLSAGSVEHAKASGSMRRNAPNPVPIIVLGRLAVDIAEARKGLGGDLLTDAMRRALKGARIIGAKALLLHALDSDRGEWYRRRGFRRLNDEELTYFLPMKTIRALP